MVASQSCSGRDGPLPDRRLPVEVWRRLIDLCKDTRLTFFVGAESLEFVEPLADLLASGQVRSAISQRFLFDEVPEAVRQMEAGTLVGKAAIAPNVA